MRRAVASLALATVLLLGGGISLVLTTLPNGAAGADTSSLGGFTVSALAEAYTVQYEQPNFPLPATPSLEVDAGYAVTSDNFGPTGSATAATFYPGQVVANAGPQLSLLVPGAPLPPAPTWPLQAVTDFPQAPNTDSLDVPGANMDATSTTNGSTATATIGNDAASAGAAGTQPTTAPSTGSNPLAGSSSIIGIGTASGTSSSTTSTTAATASASATDAGISLLDGFINLGTITSTATATSDGTTGKLTGSTSIANATIAGEQVTITGQGIAATGKTEALALPLAALNTILGELGISIKVTNATDTVAAASAARTLDGVQISINLDTLDAAASKFESLLPAKLTSSLPVALPNQQVITIDLGTVSVSSAASPSFSDLDSGTSTAAPSSSDDLGTSPSTGSDLGGGSFGAPTAGSSFGGSTTPTSGGSSPTTTGGAGDTSPVPLASTPTVFKGVGSGLILLGLLAALAMAYAYKRADDASELVGAACAEGDPLGSRFSDDDDEPGGFA